MQLIKQSVHLSWKNLILVVPFLIEAVLGFVGVFLALIVMSIFGQSFFNLDGDDSVRIYLLLGGTTFIFLIGYYIVHSFVLSGIFGMMKEVVAEKEVKMSDFFTYGKQYVWKAFWIQFIVYFVVFLLSVPMYLYFIKEFTSGIITFPFGPFVIVILYMLISMVLMLLAQFSILSVIRDNYSIGKAINISWKVLTKGFLDCLVLFGVYLMLLIPLGIIFFILNLIPFLGTIAFMALQYFLMVILLVWSVLFYDKYK